MYNFEPTKFIVHQNFLTDYTQGVIPANQLLMKLKPCQD